MRKVLFHSFSLGDVEDPELYAAVPILEWEKTDHGKWVMEHAHDPTFHIHADPAYLGFRVTITGALEERDEVYYRLKYDNLPSTHR
jgi:hypothetical protein